MPNLDTQNDSTLVKGLRTVMRPRQRGVISGAIHSWENSDQTFNIHILSHLIIQDTRVFIATSFDNNE